MHLFKSIYKSCQKSKKRKKKVFIGHTLLLVSFALFKDMPCCSKKLLTQLQEHRILCSFVFPLYNNKQVSVIVQ